MSCSSMPQPTAGLLGGFLQKGELEATGRQSWPAAHCGGSEPQHHSRLEDSGSWDVWQVIWQ